MEFALEIKEFLALTLHQFVQRNSGPARHDGRDVLVCDLGVRELCTLEFALEVQNFTLEQRQPSVLQLGGFAQIVVALGLFNLGSHMVQLTALGLEGLQIHLLEFPPRAQFYQLPLETAQLSFQI